MSLSTHRPLRSRLRSWPRPGGHTPTFRSTLQAPAPCGAWGNRGPAASRRGCSAARSRSARRGTRTGTYSWGKRSGRSDRQNRPKRTHHPRELRERMVKWLSGSNGEVIYHSVCVGGVMLTNAKAGPLADVCGVVTPQPFPRVAGVHVRARLPPLTGAHQAAGAVIQGQGHPGGTHGGLLRALASTRTDLGPGQSQHLRRRKGKIKINVIG